MPVPLVRAGGLAACALFISALVPLSAQTTRPPELPPEVDPYTCGEPERLALLGYRSFGPFLFGPAANEIVQARLGKVPILWVETEHFRLGSALAEYRPELPEEIAELRGELEELHERLASFPLKPKKLDPWLRLHLFAWRLERLHADFCARLGVRELGTGAGATRPPGPTIMVGDKFAVLLTQKKSTLARFTAEYCGQERDDSWFYNFSATRSLFFGLSDESLDLTDSDLHYALVYGATQILLMGINGFPRALPSWWQNGVALWFAREREPRVLLYAKPQVEGLPTEELADWEPLVRGRVEVGAVLGWGEMLARRSCFGQPFGDSIVLWSRIDYFMRRQGAAPPLVSALHDPGRRLDSREALAQATGTSLDALDAAWQAWVKETYRKKRR